jgi:hypothetical protein
MHQRQIKGTNRDNQQFIAGSQNRYAGRLARRSKGENVAAPKLSGLRGYISALVDRSGACANTGSEG